MKVKIFSRIGLLKFLDATAGSALCWWLGYLHYWRGGAPAPVVPDAIRRILLIRPGGMGDMILLLPAIESLRRRFPAAEIHVVCETRNRPVLALAGLDGHALAYDAEPLRVLRQLRRAAYDVVVDTEQFHHFSAVMAWISRAPIRIGYKISPARNLLYTHLINYALDGFEGEQFLRLLAPLGAEAGAPRLEGLLAGAAPDLAALPEGPRAALRRARPYVAFGPGTQARYKEWDRAKFAELAEILVRERGLDVMVVGGRDGASAGERIRARLPADRCASFAGALSLPETAAVLKGARAYVGVDSGLAHLAAAVGAPTVVVFGPSAALKWGLADARHAVVRRPVACAPCFIFGYHRPCRTIACMAGVSVADVLAACDAVLEQKG